MAKARPTPAELDESARPVLLAAIRGEARLLGAGDPPPLLAGKTGANKAVYDHLTAADRPLLRVRKEGKAELVTLTTDGFQAALPHLPAEAVGEYARAHAARLPAADRLDFLLHASRSAAGESAAVLAAAVDVMQAEATAQAAAADRRRRAEAEVIDRLAALKRADVDRLSGELAEAHALLARLGGSAPPPSSPVPPPTELPPPTDPGDLAFRRQVLKGLAAQWLEAMDHGRDEARRYLEAALRNLGGVRPIGTTGETVRFDGAIHTAAGGVADDQPVKVVRVGWELDEEDGAYTVLKARVE